MMMRRLAHVPLCQLFCANEKKGNHVSSSAADDKEEEEEEGKAKRRRTFCAALLVKCAQNSRVYTYYMYYTCVIARTCVRSRTHEDDVWDGSFFLQSSTHVFFFIGRESVCVVVVVAVMVVVMVMLS